MRDFSEYRSSAWTLIAANVLPLFGVLFFGWDAFSIIALYWLENVIIGIINVLKMLTCSPDPVEIEKNFAKYGTPEESQEMQKAMSELTNQGGNAKRLHHASKLFFIPFFIFHYGLFCMVHGAFILVFFGPGPFGGSPLDVADGMFGGVLADRHMTWAVAGLAGSHLYSFFANYLGRGEYRRTVVPWLMFQPYARIVVLHIAILLGAFLTLAFRSNVGILVLLVVGKTVLDLMLHLRERERSAESKPPIMPEEILDEIPRK